MEWCSLWLLRVLFGTLTYRLSLSKLLDVKKKKERFLKAVNFFNVVYALGLRLVT